MKSTVKSLPMGLSLALVLVQNIVQGAVPGMALSLAMVTAVSASGDAEAGRSKAFTCMGCHGVAGARNAYPGYKVPKLGGQHADYIATALKAYQDKVRYHPTMQGHAASMSEQDMADIGAYFATAPQ